jgi:hypothetical protein
MQSTGSGAGGVVAVPQFVPSFPEFWQTKPASGFPTHAGGGFMHVTGIVTQSGGGLKHVGVVGPPDPDASDSVMRYGRMPPGATGSVRSRRLGLVSALAGTGATASASNAAASRRSGNARAWVRLSISQFLHGCLAASQTCGTIVQWRRMAATPRVAK